MKSISQRLWGIALAGMLAVGGLSACNMGPTTTADLLAAYEKAENRDSYHSVSTVTLGSDDGDQIKIESTTDVAQDNSHSTTTADMFGISTTSEGYVEKAEGEDAGYVSYTSVELAGAKLWAKSKTTAVSNVGALTDSSVLADAEFAKTDTGYTLTVPAEKVYSALAGTDVTYEGLKKLSAEGLADALNTSKATYTFDQNCLLTQISCPVTYQDVDEAGNVKSSVNLNLDFTISDYGTIKAEDLAVPADVSGEAVDLDELHASITEFGNSVAETLSNFADSLGGLANSILEQSGGMSVDSLLGNNGATGSTESGDAAATDAEGAEDSESGNAEADAQGTQAAA